jgi:tetratricopeptide (TPR) repeat protein
MQAGEYQLARAAFARELDRDPYNDEVNYWQARALLQLGEIKRADDHLNTAIEYSTTLQRREIYAAKRDHLKQQLRKAG